MFDPNSAFSWLARAAGQAFSRPQEPNLPSIP